VSGGAGRGEEREAGIMPGQSNEERLREAGVLREGDLPIPHLRVVEGLHTEEVDVLIAVFKRLQAADEWHGVAPPGPGEPHNFSMFMPY
jgi:hypothetical protein